MIVWYFLHDFNLYNPQLNNDYMIFPHDIYLYYPQLNNDYMIFPTRLLFI